MAAKSLTAWNKLKTLPYIFLLAATTVSACAADKAPPIDLKSTPAEFHEVFDYLNKKNAVAVERLSERYDACDELAQSAEIAPINTDLYRAAQITRKDFQSALLYKHSENFDACLGSTKSQMVLNYTRLNAFIFDNFDAFTAEEKSYFDMSRPFDILGQLSLYLGETSVPEMKIKLHFEALSSRQKDYFETLFGDEPFSLQAYPLRELPADE